MTDAYKLAEAVRIFGPDATNLMLVEQRKASAQLARARADAIAQRGAETVLDDLKAGLEARTLADDYAYLIDQAITEALEHMSEPELLTLLRRKEARAADAGFADAVRFLDGGFTYER